MSYTLSIEVKEAPPIFGETALAQAEDVLFMLASNECTGLFNRRQHRSANFPEVDEAEPTFRRETPKKFSYGGERGGEGLTCYQCTPQVCQLFAFLFVM